MNVRICKLVNFHLSHGGGLPNYGAHHMGLLQAIVGASCMFFVIQLALNNRGLAKASKRRGFPDWLHTTGLLEDDCNRANTANDRP